MAMKKKTKVNPQIAKMNAARAAKRAAVEPPPKKPAPRATAQDEIENYGNAYGDASRPLHMRRTGTQPNNRAKSAVERAEARMAERRGTPAQPPGMDVEYDADAALEDFYEGDADDDSEVYPTEEELADAQERLSEMIARRNGMLDTDGLGEISSRHKARTPKGVRMAPIGRGEAHRGVSRQPLRRNAQGRVMVTGRDGRIISRTASGSNSDKFDVPLHLIPDGWSYQWIAVAVNGKNMNNQGMFANGWEAVPAQRHDGMFTAKGTDGPIIVDDQMLCERRIELTLEARAEELAVAKNLLRTQNEQFKPRLPDARNRRGTGLRVRRTLERLPDDIGRPNLPLDI